MEGKNTDARIESHFDLATAKRTTLIEEEKEELPLESEKALKYKIGHHAIETVKLFLK